MTVEQKVRVKEQGKEVLDDKKFLQEIADKSGGYIDLEVRQGRAGGGGHVSRSH